MIGYATIRAQLGWCAAAGVPQAIFTHCGTAIVDGEPSDVEAVRRALARAHGVRVQIASDGMQVPVRPRAGGG